MGTPVSGLMLTAKAKIIYEKLYGNNDINCSVVDMSDTSQ